MKARQKEVYDENGDLNHIEVTLEDGEHLFDAQWDPNDEQTEEKRIEFRQWVKRIVAQKGHQLT